MIKWFPRWYLWYYQKRYRVQEGELQSRVYLSKLIELLELLDLDTVDSVRLEMKSLYFWNKNGIVLFNQIENYRSLITRNEDIVIKEIEVRRSFRLADWLCSHDSKPIILNRYIPRLCSLVRQLLVSLDQHEKLEENNIDYYHRRCSRLMDDLVELIHAFYASTH